ncbi:MAG TPA: VWA domain-containing protein [Chloroflexota bacterium]|nr:VWA domain-containing protein [Chloroflexota bacterium]
MTLLQPAALGALIVLPLILLLYILRPRHRRLIVPSVRLWRHLSSDLEGRPRWRLPLASLLLFLQLIAAGALAIALARPALPGGIGQHLILLVDTSPTMLATDVSPNRLAAAVTQARQLVSELGPDDRVTLIKIAPVSSIIATGAGPHALDAALDRLEVSPTRGDLLGALALAAQTAQNSPETHNRVVILSDGAFDSVPIADIGTISADVSFQQIGGSDENQGITALSVRPMIGSVNRYLGFIQVANFAHHDASVTIQAMADGLPIFRRVMTIPARQPVELSLSLPQGTHLVRVQLSAQDRYALDNQADILVPDPRPIPVTVVAEDPSLWQKALKTLPSVDLRIQSPSSYRPDDAAVTIFNGFVPARLPSGSIVLVAPPPGNPLIPVSGVLAPATLVRADEGNPLFDSADVIGLIIQQPERIGPLSWARPIAETAAGPVIFQGQLQGRQAVIIGFDPAGTDWPERIAFPVFVANLIQALSPSAFPLQIEPGSVLDMVPSPEAKTIAFRLPNGKIDLFQNSGRPLRFTDTAQRGTYVVTELNGQTTVETHEFVVSKLGLAESDIAPRLDPQVLARAGSPPGRPVEHDVWPWFAGGALAVLTLEWIIFFRRLAP